MPPRPADAPTGSAVVKRLYKLGAGEREHALVEEVLRGNIPDFERALVPVPVEGTNRKGERVSGRVFVVPDYLAIGSDDDFVRVPMTIRAARRVARTLGALLPTPHLVDVIHRTAKVHISSPSMTPGDDMGSIAYFVAHDKEIEERRKARGEPLGLLLSGPKKDLVITKRMLGEPGRTPIYGWFGHDTTEPIQPLSLTHDDRYVDYAHGIRLVNDEMEVDGELEPLLEVLADKDLAALVSDEGAYDLRIGWARGW